MAALEKMIRPAEGLPTWRELVDSEIKNILSVLKPGEKFLDRAEPWMCLPKRDIRLILRALNRDPKTGKEMKNG